MMNEIIEVLIIVYVLSMLACVIFKKQLIANLDEEESIFTHDYVVGFITFVPLLNTLFVLASIKDYFMTKYLIWKTKKILRKIVGKIEDPELKEEIKELLNNEL